MVSFSAGQEASRRLLEGPQRYTCLAGATRSGKTFLIVRTIVMRALQEKGSRHAILRFRANAARASIALGTLPKVVELCFPSILLKEHRQEGYFALPNGSRIWIGGLDGKDRVEKILGLEYATVFLNEASQIPYSSALIAFTSLAQSTHGICQHAFVDLNPSGKSHWINVLFGNKRDSISMQMLKDPENYKRAFLNPPDNVANLSKEFLASLENLPEKQRKRFYEGVYIDEVDDALWNYETIESNRCTPEDIPTEKRAAVVVALDPSGAAGRDDFGADESAWPSVARGNEAGRWIPMKSMPASRGLNLGRTEQIGSGHWSLSRHSPLRTLLGGNGIIRQDIIYRRYRVLSNRLLFRLCARSRMATIFYALSSKHGRIKPRVTRGILQRAIHRRVQ
jgi:Terminase large subunit, T4likevirus-type, N-terminal